MRLLLGAITYLSVVSAIVALAIVAVLELKPGPATTAAAARNEEPPQAAPLPPEAPQSDARRTPVWIAPTTKYDYTPPPRDRGAETRQTEKRQPPKADGGKRAGLRARARDDARRAIESALGNTEASASRPALGFQRGRRDNDPFFRD